MRLYHLLSQKYALEALKKKRLSIIVYFFVSPANIYKGKRKSFQIFKTVYIKAVAIAGFISGSTTLKNTPIGVAPSITADSSISLGTVAINPVRINMGSGLKVAI